MRSRCPAGAKKRRGASAGRRGAGLAPALAPALALFLSAAGGCSDEPMPTETPSPTAALDHSGPTILMTPIEDGQARGVDIPLEATITDASGVAFAAVYFRTVGVDYWASEPLIHQGDGLYRGLIPGNYVGEAGVDYYIEAKDASPNRNLSQYPPNGVAYPLYFSTLGDPIPFPYAGGFEPDEDVDLWRLGETGWTAYVRGFYDGFNWQLSDRNAAGGLYSAYHDHGSPYQNAPFEDWLVSPPIDLGDAETVALHWMEFIDHPEFATHQIKVSLGSADPADNHYIDVATLDPGPGDAWLRSQHVDLSQFAGAPQAFIAFVYEGLWADDWYIDDIVIDVHRSDLVMGHHAFIPERVQPGGQAILTLNLENQGLAATGEGLEILLSSTEAGVDISPERILLPAIEAGAQQSLGSIAVLVDGAFEPDRFAPILIEARDGETLSFSETVKLPVGQPPSAHIEITHDFENDIQLYIGYGDPDFPTYFEVVQVDGGADNGGIFTWDLDLDGQRDAFPPNTDENQWFVEVWDDSPVHTGTLNAFILTYGEDSYAAEALPRAIPDDGQVIRQFIPGKADLQLAQTYIEPTRVAPGDGVSLNFDVYNLAAPPTGALYGELVTSEGDILSLDPQGELAFEYTPITGSSVYGLARPPGPYTFQVDGDHVNSKSLDLTLILRDDLNLWTLPIDIPVPYPVYDHVILFTEEAPENNPSTPTPTPTASEEEGVSRALVIGGKNRGDLDAFGEITAEVTVVDVQGARIDVAPGPHILYPHSGQSGENGGLKAGGLGQTQPIVMTAYGADYETQVTLDITLSDGQASHSERRIISVIDPPWNAILPEDDALGDHQASDYDLIGGQYWLGGSFLRMQWTVDRPMDPLNTTFYTYLSTHAGHRYAYLYLDGEIFTLRWIDQGDGKGYFTKSNYPPQSLNAYFIDNRTIEFSLDLTDINYVNRDLYGGASVGECGAGTCDDAPNFLHLSGNLEAFYWD